MAALRFGALVAALLLTGCQSSDAPPPTGPGFDENGCQVGCARCPPEAACVSSPYVPACRQACTTIDDCATGERCAIASGDANGAAVCLAPHSLTVCHDEPCALVPRCRDAKTALVPLPATFGVCGWALVSCDSGCDPMVGNCK